MVKSDSMSRLRSMLMGITFTASVASTASTADHSTNYWATTAMGSASNSIDFPLPMPIETRKLTLQPRSLETPNYRPDVQLYSV